MCLLLPATTTESIQVFGGTLCFEKIHNKFFETFEKKPRTTAYNLNLHFTIFKLTFNKVARNRLPNSFECSLLQTLLQSLYSSIQAIFIFAMQLNLTGYLLYKR